MQICALLTLAMASPTCTGKRRNWWYCQKMLHKAGKHMKSTISHLAKPHWTLDINENGSNGRDRIWGRTDHYEYLQVATIQTQHPLLALKFSTNPWKEMGGHKCPSLLNKGSPLLHIWNRTSPLRLLKKQRVFSIFLSPPLCDELPPGKFKERSMDVCICMPVREI